MEGPFVSSAGQQARSHPEGPGAVQPANPIRISSRASLERSVCTTLTAQTLSHRFVPGTVPILSSPAPAAPPLQCRRSQAPRWQQHAHLLTPAQIWFLTTEFFSALKQNEKINKILYRTSTLPGKLPTPHKGTNREGESESTTPSVFCPVDDNSLFGRRRLLRLRAPSEDLLHAPSDDLNAIAPPV